MTARMTPEDGIEISQSEQDQQCMMPPPRGAWSPRDHREKRGRGSRGPGRSSLTGRFWVGKMKKIQRRGQ